MAQLPENSSDATKRFLLPSDVPCRGNAFSKGVGRLVLWLYGWKVRGTFPNQKKMVLIVAPHTSNWDFVIGFAVYLAFGMRATWFGKHTIFKGLFGSLLKWLGGVPIKRQKNHGFVEQLIEKFNSQEKALLALAPEGTRKKTEGWKKGFYYIALGGKAPIFMVSLDYPSKILEFGPVIWPNGDFDQQFKEMNAYYQTKTPKKPGMF